MGYTFSCKDLGGECDFVAEAKTEKELLEKVAEHGKTVHGMTEIPKDMQKKISRLLREDRAA